MEHNFLISPRWSLSLFHFLSSELFVMSFVSYTFIDPPVHPVSYDQPSEWLPSLILRRSQHTRIPFQGPSCLSLLVFASVRAWTAESGSVILLVWLTNRQQAPVCTRVP